MSVMSEVAERFIVKLCDEGKLLPSYRYWVGILSDRGIEMVRRRSIILVPGPNRLVLDWPPTLKASGFARSAGLYAQENAVSPVYETILTERKYLSIYDHVDFILYVTV